MIKRAIARDQGFREAARNTEYVSSRPRHTAAVEGFSRLHATPLTAAPYDAAKAKT